VLPLRVRGVRREEPLASRTHALSDTWGLAVGSVLCSCRSGWSTEQLILNPTVSGPLAGVELRGAGRKQLKGIPGSQQLYEVVWG